MLYRSSKDACAVTSLPMVASSSSRMLDAPTEPCPYSTGLPSPLCDGACPKLDLRSYSRLPPLFWLRGLGFAGKCAALWCVGEGGRSGSQCPFECGAVLVASAWSGEWCCLGVWGAAGAAGCTGVEVEGGVLGFFSNPSSWLMRSDSGFAAHVLLLESSRTWTVVGLDLGAPWEKDFASTDDVIRCSGGRPPRDEGRDWLWSWPPSEPGPSLLDRRRGAPRASRSSAVKLGLAAPWTRSSMVFDTAGCSNMMSNATQLLLCGQVIVRGWGHEGAAPWK
jgi:hypothetical protein